MASENVGSGDLPQDVSGSALEAIQEVSSAPVTPQVLPGQGFGQTTGYEPKSAPSPQPPNLMSGVPSSLLGSPDAILDFLLRQQLQQQATAQASSSSMPPGVQGGPAGVGTHNLAPPTQALPSGFAGMPPISMQTAKTPPSLMPNTPMTQSVPQSLFPGITTPQQQGTHFQMAPFLQQQPPMQHPHGQSWASMLGQALQDTALGAQTVVSSALNPMLQAIQPQVAPLSLYPQAPPTPAYFTPTAEAQPPLPPQPQPQLTQELLAQFLASQVPPPSQPAPQAPASVTGSQVPVSNSPLDPAAAVPLDMVLKLLGITKAGQVPHKSQMFSGLTIREADRIQITALPSQMDYSQ